jgi:hypothetical protein
MNEKQQKAAKIKDLTEQLRQEIEQAEQMGLTIAIEVPHKGSFSERPLSVKVVEVLTY